MPTLPPRLRLTRGFSLIETMLVMFFTLIIVFVLLTVSDSAQKMSRDQAEALEVETNLRAGTESLARDLNEAGLGLLHLKDADEFGCVFANRGGVPTGYTDSEISFLINRPGISTTSTRVGVHAQVAFEMCTTSDAIDLYDDWDITQPGEFAAGDRVLIIGPTDGNGCPAPPTPSNGCGTCILNMEWFTIGSLTAYQIQPAGPLAFVYARGSVIVKASLVSYYMGTDSDRPVLIRREGQDVDSPSTRTFPIAENLVAAGGAPALKFEYFGLDVVPNALTSASTPAINSIAGREVLRKVRITMTAQPEIVSRTKRTEKLRARTYVSELSPKNLISRKKKP